MLRDFSHMDNHQLLSNLKQIHQQILLLLSNDFVFEPNAFEIENNFTNEPSTEPSVNSEQLNNLTNNFLDVSDPLSELLDYSLLQNVENFKSEPMPNPVNFSLSDAILDDLFENDN